MINDNEIERQTLAKFVNLVTLDPRYTVRDKHALHPTKEILRDGRIVCEAEYNPSGGDLIKLNLWADSTREDRESMLVSAVLTELDVIDGVALAVMGDIVRRLRNEAARRTVYILRNFSGDPVGVFDSLGDALDVKVRSAESISLPDIEDCEFVTERPKRIRFETRIRDGMIGLIQPIMAQAHKIPPALMLDGDGFRVEYCARDVNHAKALAQVFLAKWITAADEQARAEHDYKAYRNIRMDDMFSGKE